MNGLRNVGWLVLALVVGCGEEAPGAEEEVDPAESVLEDEDFDSVVEDGDLRMECFGDCCLVYSGGTLCGCCLPEAGGGWCDCW